MPDHSAPTRALEAADIEAVRTALYELRDDDERLGIYQIAGPDGDTVHRAPARAMRRLLVDELIEFLEARESLVELQIQSSSAELLSDEPATSRWSREP